MNVIVARHMGMCFGVRDALEVAHTVPQPGQVTIHGELVHNEQVMADLAGRGFHLTPEDRRDGIPQTPFALITAHGVSEREWRRLEAAGKTLIDTTCPLVRSVHQTVAKLQAEGRFIVVIGRADHVEVRGIIGDLDACAVVSRERDVVDWHAPRLGVVCQTTAAAADVRRLHRRIVALNRDSDVRFVNTICRPTRLRQVAVEDLLGQVQALVVVGGRRSNNTRKLAERAAERGVPCQVVQTAAGLDERWCRQFDTVGLTAGTSTPPETVSEVHRALLQMCQSELREAV